TKFQQLNKANLSLWEIFEKNAPESPWQLGQTMALGIGDVDYALTTVVDKNNKPVGLGIVSYVDASGNLQTRAVVDYVGQLDDGRDFGGLFLVNQSKTESLINGQQTTINIKTDTEANFFGFVLRQDKSWNEFLQAMIQSQTQEQRQKAFDANVEIIYIQDPKTGRVFPYKVGQLPIEQRIKLINYLLPTSTSESIQFTPTPSSSPTPESTPTPTEIPQPTLSEIGVSQELQKTLETKQGWVFKWDASRAAYLITQAAWDENKATFTASTLGEVGYIDREGNLHLYTTSFSAEPGQESAFVASQTNSEIVLNLKSLPAIPEVTPTANPQENNAKETALGPFTLIETKNPLFEKTGILKITDENGNTYVYAPQVAISVEIDGRKIVEFYSASLSTFGKEQKNIDPSTITVLDWDALHKGLGPLLAIAGGFDRPFPKNLPETFEGYKIYFQAYPELKKKDNPQIPAIAFFSYAPLYNKNGNVSYSADQGPIRYARDANGNIPIFYTITPDGKRIVSTLMQLYNPADPTHQAKEDIFHSLIIPAALGEMSNEQIESLPEFFSVPYHRYFPDEGLIRLSPQEMTFPMIILASQGDLFAQISNISSDLNNLRSLLSPKSKETLTRLFISSYTHPNLLSSLDQLLGREGNDVGEIKWQQGEFDFSVNIPYWLDQLGKNNTNVAEITFDSDKFPLEIQLILFGLGF
ncbi:MAG: hypothetical protein ACPLRN_03805, partial [Microgenomates group bacterium]